MRYQRLLLDEKTRILRQRGYTEALLRERLEPDVANGARSRADIGDMGYETYQRELASRLTTEETELLKEIELALRRISEGTYGRCENCGTAISEARLAVVPHARICSKCLLRMREAKKTP
ncbi:MAG: TraR/DksA C4-type zinc finger protein [candidate division WOR-3 bacterium]